MPIRPLPQSLINKIAAGEVIERPASVVKELMENSVDAGATRIDVSIQAGGIEMVRVVDNGGGIPADEMLLAIAAHATSKLVDVDDLFRVHTLGFRGEALASIAEISRLTLRSRTPDSPGGAEVEVVGGQASAVTPCGCPVGTAIEVRNLFFNTPVRRKFLRATATELGHVSEAFIRVALAMPEVHFTLRHNDKPVFELPGGEDWRERIGRVFGRQLAERLIWVESVDGMVQLSGYVAHPSESRSNNRMQYLFLNGRAIRDRSLQHALGEAYRGLLMTGRMPIAFLTLAMPAEMVDVNVHPTKLEVRFQDSGPLYSQLLSTLRTKFLNSDLTTRVETPPEDDPGAAVDMDQTSQIRQRVVEWAKGEVQSWTSRSSSAAPGGTSGPHAPLVFGPRSQPLAVNRLDRRWSPASGSQEEAPWDASESSGSETSAASAASPATPAPEAPLPSPALPESREAVKALQAHNRYLVTESEEGVVIFDQHALHERILYEQLRQRVTSGPMETQNLLVPEPIDLSPAETAAALAHRDVLARLGMKIEPFGGDTLLVVGFPAMLANLNPQEILRSLLEPLMQGGKKPDHHDLLDDLLHTVACKAAIKAGDRLAPEEIQALLDLRHLVDDPHHCPHGRPTALVFSREELDKQFRRV